MEITFNKKYLILNLIGWVGLFFFTLTIPRIFIHFSIEKFAYEQYIPYKLLEGLICAFIAFGFSLMLSSYIEKEWDFGKLYRKQIIQFVFLFLVVQFFYSVFTWSVLIFIANLLESDVFSENSFVAIVVVNIPYFATLFCIWLFVFFSIKTYQHLKHVQLKQLSLESTLRESQLNTLKGQINPHFMFNSLNNIRGLILEDASKSREMITRLSEMLRYSLTKSTNDSIPLEEELEMVENYVSISKIQLEDRLQFITNIDERYLHKPIPPMIIQLLVENAIKHGIAPLKEGGTVHLEVGKTATYFFIKVSNTGKLRITSNTTKLGLENIKKRLKLLYDEQATFSLTENENQVIAEIKMP